MILIDTDVAIRVVTGRPGLGADARTAVEAERMRFLASDRACSA